MRCVKLYKNTIKILGIHYSYNKQLKSDENFKKYIAKIENMLNMSIIDRLNKTQKNFILNRLNPKQ